MVAAGSSFAQEKRMIDDIREYEGELAVWWAGHNSWIVKAGDLVVATDLWLESSSHIQVSPITAEELASVIDVSFVTHAHSDHFHEPTSRILLEKSSCVFVVPESCLGIARKLKIPDHRLVIAKPRMPFEIKGVKVAPIRAIHGNADFAIYYEANLNDCGYLFEVAGKTFLQPGDSYLLEDHLFLKKVNVLFFSPTEHNMYIDRSLILINELDPDYIFPQHHSTVIVDDNNRFWAKGYPDEVKVRLSRPLKDKYHVLKIGEKMVIR